MDVSDLLMRSPDFNSFYKLFVKKKIELQQSFLFQVFIFISQQIQCIYFRNPMQTENDNRSKHLLA